MKCTVLLFAHLRDAIGRDRLTLDLPESARVKDALDALASQFDAVASMRGRLAVAVDETYRTGEFMLPDNCTIALIPPVSGG